MTKHNCLSLALVLSLLAHPAPAQFGILKGGDKKNEAKEREKEVKRAAKEAGRYDKIREFSLDLYDKDLDFREAVDDQFESILREHSELAFHTNVDRTSRTFAIQEDRFRRHYALYDNLAIQDYVNRLGQRLVPADSEKLFAFRLTPDPVPTAQTLSTGTIYISTGLVALLDSEAQLAYVLAHEMAHVYKDHWKLKPMMALGQEKYNEKQETKQVLWSLAGAGVGSLLGGAIGRNGTAVGLGAVSGLGAGLAAGMITNPTMHVAFDRVQEDEADQLAFKACLDINYDVREVPKLYATLQSSGAHDNRVTLGFLGNRKRVRERIENTKDLLEKTFKAELDLKQSKSQLVGDNPSYRHLMAELKRDNGIMAYFKDMFSLAKANLEEAVSIRSNDAAAHYYYGKVLKLVGRTQDEQKTADKEFVLAAKYDTRGQNFGAHLHRALALMDEKSDSNREVVLQELQSYVDSYLRFAINNARSSALLPPNLDTIYEYMSLVGDTSWMPKVPEDAPIVPVTATPGGQPPSVADPPGPTAPPVRNTPTTPKPLQKIAVPKVPLINKK